MCLFFHKWGKWTRYTFRGKVMHSGILCPSEVRGKWFNISEERQKRKCLKCGFEQDVEIE